MRSSLPGCASSEHSHAEHQRSIRSDGDGREVTIIGAGIGGLCAAIRLASAGARVTVLEKNGMPGGRCGRIDAQGFAFDIGPTILLVPSVLAELFREAGRDVRDYLAIEALSPNYRVHYGDGSTFTLYRDRERMRAELARIEPGSQHRYDDFLRAGSAQMTAAMERFAVTHYASVGEFLSPGVFADLLRARAFRSVHGHVSRFFRDPRLQQAFSFQTMYLGLSPYDAPAIFGLLPYTELADGVFYTRGGLYQIPLALEKLARELGVTFHYDTEVTRLRPENGRIAAVQLADGSERRVDVVLCNADLPNVYEKLLPEAPLARASSLKYTSSGFMLYLGLDRTYEGLEHHNVFFGDRFRESFDEIFQQRVIPQDLSFYVAAPSVTDPTQAPAGCTAMYVLVPVPHQFERVDWARAEEGIRTRVLDRLERVLCPDLRKHIVVERRINPDGWARMFGLKHGSAFGLSHTLDQVGAMRPRNRDATFGNLYFCGASTQPGTGIPLVAISGRLAADRILRESGVTHDGATVGRRPAPRFYGSGIPFTKGQHAGGTIASTAPVPVRDPKDIPTHRPARTRTSDRGGQSESVGEA